ncbi:MAG: hypothetical protein AAFV85_27195 [Cyanobacteria bacterium J06634_6]
MSLDTHLKKLNRKLDRVRILQRPRTNKLCLRATLPPKPGETAPKQRYLSTGKPANGPGADEANKLAKRLDAELIEGTFKWENWDPKVAESLRAKTIGELSQRILDMKRPQVQPTGLKQRYQVPLSKLPQDALPTEELLRTTIERECEGYPTKWDKYKISYSMLAELAGIKHEFQKLGPRSQAVVKPITPQDLPSDELILETWQSIDNPLYKILFARMACYGLRPHEAWKCIVSDNPEDPFCRVLADTKTGKATGGRITYPIPREWYALMQPWQDFEPHQRRMDWRKKTNIYLGHRIGQWFERRKLPFYAYMLRHAWAVRTAKANMSTAAAAKMMGHSQDVHERIYQQALGKEGLMEAWKNIF